MQKHIEMSLKKKQTAAEMFTGFLLSVAPIIVSCYILMLVLSMKLTAFLAIALVLCGLSIFAAYKIYCGFNIDWEYIYLDDEMRFSKIVNKTRRKELLTVDLTKAEAVARVNDAAHNGYLKNSSYKKYSFKTNTDAECWLIASVSAKGERVCVIFEPDERMLEALRLTVRSKFFA